MPQLRVLEGSTFCICDEVGDIVERTHGLFADDMRVLSRLRLTVDGKRPLLLSSGTVDYFSAACFLRNPVSENLPLDAVSIKRERFVGEGMQDNVVLQNQTMSSVRLQLELELASDFADIISVKDWDFTLGNPEHARPLPEPVEPRWEDEHNQFVLTDEEGFARTQVILSRRGEMNGNGVVYDVLLEPRERWELRIDVLPSPIDGPPRPPHAVKRDFGAERSRVRDSLEVWQLRVPQIRASWDGMKHAFRQSVNDLAALRMRTDDESGLGRLPAAGCPWFMTVFGRDTLITCLQTLVFGPELARSALRELAKLQATEDDASRDAEPGKIVHELRRGKCAANWFDRYYGSVDSTPLFLILLSEVWRWTDDTAFARELQEPALAALRWIDEYGDRDGDGFVEYERRTPRGLANQSWKDSGDSQRFSDGSTARGPIAPCEVQGYVYDAKRRICEVARDAWREPELAERLDREAEELRARFDDAFWIDDRGGYYALALDGEKRKVDSLCSNIGHLLWSGIVPPQRVDPIEAAGSFGNQLPEVFAGFARRDTPFPVQYPTAARPQAWAAGTPVLLLQILLGLQPDRRRQVLETVAPLDLPSWTGTARLAGVRAFGRGWDVRLGEGGVTISEA